MTDFVYGNAGREARADYLRHISGQESLSINYCAWLHVFPAAERTL